MLKGSSSYLDWYQSPGLRFLFDMDVASIRKELDPSAKGFYSFVNDFMRLAELVSLYWYKLMAQLACSRRASRPPAALRLVMDGLGEKVDSATAVAVGKALNTLRREADLPAQAMQKLR